MAARVPPGPAPSPTASGRAGRLAAVARVAAGLALLALAAAAGAALEPGSNNGLAHELARQERQRRMLRGLLGDDRSRLLDAARFAIELHDHESTPGLSDDPDRHQDLAEVLLGSLAKLSVKSIERRLRLIERRDALRRRLRQQHPGAGRDRALDISPRLRLGAHPWVGLKLAPARSGPGPWRGLSLRLGSELDGGDPSLKLGFKSRSRRAFVAYHPDDPESGSTVELQVGLSF